MFRNTKPRTQVAAFPYVVTDSGIEVLLVTTRRTGQWILPRGWPEEGMSYGKSAAMEALEEAGVVGDLGQEALGDYLYNKNTGKGYLVPCRVFVFPLLVTEQRLDWLEKHQRRQQWLDLASAADMVQQDGLVEFLKDLGRAPDLISRLADEK